MALFDDAPINGIDELAPYDSSLLETAAIEGIDVTAKIASAQDLLRTEILRFLLDNEVFEPVFGGVLDWQRRELGMEDVVVTPELKRWHAFQTLREVYEDAYGHQSNDRYQWKWQDCGRLARNAKARCLDIGIGLAADPIQRAQPPVITTAPGTGDAVTLYLAVALLNAGGQEGVVSEVAMAKVAAGTQAGVSVSNPPANATGWNIYAGSGPEYLMQQNGDALALAAVWTQSSVLVAGRAPGKGQTPSFHAVRNRMIRRG